MNLAIILNQPYPYGYACTNRIHYYAQGVNEAGGKSKIYIPNPTEYDTCTAKNHHCNGDYKGVSFEYTCGTTTRPENFISRRFAYYKGLIKTAINLYRDRKEIDAVLIVTNALKPLLFFKIVTVVLKKKYIQEKSELPFYNKSPKNIIEKTYQKFYTKYVYKLFDGIIVISKPLYDYFSGRVKKESRILQVPVIVDASEFLETKKRPSCSYIAYCGNFTQAQDGVLNLIEAFKIIAEQYTNLRLCLIGEANKKEDKLKVEELISKLSLSHKIDLEGYVDRDELVKLLVSAKVLVLAKPKSLQAEYCFPSKLAEYLITSTPVIVTNVGVIGDYLSDGVDSLLAVPSSVQSIAEKITKVLSDEKMALEIGAKGRDIALNNFSYQMQVGRIIKFIDELPCKSKII